MGLPIIDLSTAASDPVGFESALLDATHRVGFFYLVGHGIGTDRMADVLRSARAFFAVPHRNSGGYAKNARLDEKRVRG